MATIVFLGTLGADPENSVTPNGAENIKFRAAENVRQGQNELTTWYAVTSWGGSAKGLTTLAERGLLAKGARVYVVGSLTAREYQDRNGITRTSLDVNAHDVQLVNPPKNAQQPAYGYGANPANAPYMGDDVNMSEIPF